MRRIKFFIGLSLLIFFLSFISPIFPIYATAAVSNDEDAAVKIQMDGELTADSADFYEIGPLNDGTVIMVMLYRAVGVQEGGGAIPAQLNIELIEAKSNDVVEAYTISAGKTAHFTISSNEGDTFYVLKVSSESRSFMGLPLPSLPLISTPNQPVDYEGQILVIK